MQPRVQPLLLFCALVVVLLGGCSETAAESRRQPDAAGEAVESPGTDEGTPTVHTASPEPIVPHRQYDLEIPPAWEGPGLPEGLAWSRNQSFYPEGANVVFATSDGCGLCHSTSSRALAMKTDDGEDISPWGTWRGTLMSQSYVDPYWRAAVAQAVAREPGKRADIEGFCLRCHGPMASHTARLSQEASPALEEADLDPLAYDGISCTVCHQALPTNFGSPESFNGQLDIRPGRAIYGPYPEPALGTMLMESEYAPTHSPHVQDSALCGSCHTLETQAAPESPHFLEQATYLEWRNSEFTSEPAETPTSRSCQQCHMPLVEDTAIARDDGGGDLNIPARTNVRSHAIVGGNAFMLDLLRTNADELQVEAHPQQLQAVASATRKLLRESTATLHLENVRRVGDRLHFDIRVENLTGHKLPTGYPSRRMWLNVRVLDGERTLFASGETDLDGRLVGIPDERALPHRTQVSASDEVAVWELIPADSTGATTTVLTAMERIVKDTRILPRGWTAIGRDAARTAPVGIAGDADFIGGSDTVGYRVPLPDRAPADRGLRSARVEVALLYQAIPPAWVDPLRDVRDEAAERFVRMYDAEPGRTELLARFGATLSW